MTAKVITIAPDASIADAGELLLTHRISGAPVVDADGQILGIVSRGDLLRRVEAGTEGRRSWWLEIFTRSDTLAAEYVKAHGRRVADIMTRWVVSVTEDKAHPRAARGQLIGIISRANVLQAIAGRRPLTPIVRADDRPSRTNPVQAHACALGVSHGASMSRSSRGVVGL